MKTLLPHLLAVAALIAATFLGIRWQQSVAEIDAKDVQIQKQSKEIQELQQQQALSNATNDMLTRRLGQVSANPLRSPILNELEAVERRKRIPAGATDPDKMWKGQMKAAQDVIRASGMPATR
jgi:hypothetical protein